MRENIRALLSATSAMLLSATLCYANPWPGLSAELERALERPQAQERRAAARRIAELTPVVASKVLDKAINDRDVEVRLIGLRTARAFHLEELGSLALPNMKSTDVRERVEAVRLIALSSGEDEVEALEVAASDADESVRREAAEALGGLRKEFAPRATAKLLSMLDDVDRDVRMEVAASLGRLSASSATLALAARLKDQEPAVRAQVALALGAIGAETAVPALQVALLDIDDSVVAAVVRALGALGSEDVIVGLVAIAEDAPRRQQGEEALEALVRLSEFPLARERLLDMLESSEHRLVLRGIFARGVPGADLVLRQCIEKYSSEIALFCARAHRTPALIVPQILAAQDEGRLSSRHTLEVLSGVLDRTAVILALEQLSLGGSLEFKSALDYLTSLSQIPWEAQGPLLDALRAPGRSLDEIRTLLLVLGEVDSGSSQDVIAQYLDSTEETIRTAASTALTRLGASGAELEGYLIGEKAVARGALQGLARGMTTEQAQVLIGLVDEGHSGRRDALLSAFFAMPERLPAESLTKLEHLYLRARGADRDALLYPLVRAGTPRSGQRLLSNSARPDLLKIAQLGWYQPKSRELLKQLVRNSDPHVSALAARSLGRVGEAEDAAVLINMALSERAYLVRAAALQGLYFLTVRGHVSSISQQVLSTETCSTRHDLLRAEAIRLAASLEKPCAGRELEDVLAHDPDPRMRRLAASLLVAQRPDSNQLRACRFYERRLEVARECEPWAGSGSVGSSDSLPFRVERVWGLGEPLELTPYAVRAPAGALGEARGPGFSLRLFTDRAGHAVVPHESLAPVDPHWQF